MNYYELSTDFHFFRLFPVEIQQIVVSFLCQPDLLNLTLTSRLTYKLATKILYSKIYLNDSYIENSDIYTLAPTWSWLQLDPSIKCPDDTKNQANDKLKLLLRTFEEQKRLMNFVVELRLNWDLDISLQRDLLELLMNNSQSLRVIENITNPLLNLALETAKYTDNLTSLDLPPPNPFPSVELPDDYLENTKRFMKLRISDENILNIKKLTIFLEPLILFNNFVKAPKPFQVESIKLHCRPDIYPSSMLKREDWKYDGLQELFDVQHLKVLTIISWYDSQPPDSLFLFDQWAEFKYLEDITLISVIYDDVKISNLINNCNVLKRLKLDFSTPRRETAKGSKIYESIFKHKESLEFLDIKIALTYRIVNLDIREFRVVIKVPCQCYLCQKLVDQDIYTKKILGGDKNYSVSRYEGLRAIDFFDHFNQSSLSPYAKSVDKYPSVKTGTDDIQDFLDKFNKDNACRENFIPLNQEDFYNLYHCLIHSFKPDMKPFVDGFPKLKFFVLSDISFIINEDKEGNFRYPEPLFYNHGFITNFGMEQIMPKHIDETEVVGPPSTIF